MAVVRACLGPVAGIIKLMLDFPKMLTLIALGALVLASKRKTKGSVQRQK